MTATGPSTDAEVGHRAIVLVLENVEVKDVGAGEVGLGGTSMISFQPASCLGGGLPFMSRISSVPARPLTSSFR